jgi:hypothetical protein
MTNGRWTKYGWSGMARPSGAKTGRHAAHTDLPLLPEGEAAGTDISSRTQLRAALAAEETVKITPAG